MTVAVSTTGTIPVPRSSLSGPARPALPAGGCGPSTCRAVAYQRVLHQVVRREWRLLGELATWAPAGGAGRTATLTPHAELIGGVLLHHPAVEREAGWPPPPPAPPRGRSTAVPAAGAGWAA